MTFLMNPLAVRLPYVTWQDDFDGLASLTEQSKISNVFWEPGGASLQITMDPSRERGPSTEAQYQNGALYISRRDNDGRGSLGEGCLFPE